MTVSDAIRLRGRTRWSAAAKCPRMAVYGLRGVDPSEPDERTKRLWRRGRQLGADIASDFAAKYGDGNVIFEKAIAWPKNDLPLGELHTDVFVKPEKMAVEVKSSTSPASIMDDAITQLGGEIYFDDEAEIGCLAIVDPTGYRETELLPVFLTDELQARVENIADQVATAAKGGELPHRVCSKPSDGRGKFCPFVDVCFADWQPPSPISLDGEIASIAVEYHQAHTDEAAAKAVLAEREERRRELGAQLSAFDLSPSIDYSGSGIRRLRRTAFPDSLKFSLSKASKAGIFSSAIWTPEHEALIAPFVKASGDHDRWTVELEHGTVAKPSAEDFGDAAPWTDEDLDGPAETLGGFGG
jgi:hypothetical protein